MSSFHEYLDRAFASLHTSPRILEPGECRTSTGSPCHLCYAVTHAYETELRAKNAALEQFWKSQFSDPPLAPLLPSPGGRAYRTLSKRKAFFVRDSIRLGLIDPEQENAQGRAEVHNCAIEPPQHAAIYSYLQATLPKPHCSALAQELRHCIVKGSYSEFVVILTVHNITPSVMKAANTVSKGLTRVQKDVIGVFLYEDRSRGGYYLGMSDPESPGKVHKIFGKKNIYHRVGGKGFLVPPLAFSQINHTQLETLTATATQLLSPRRDAVLYDLYCGYGLFSLALADQYRNVLGIEVSAESVEAARENAERLGITNVRFKRANLTADGVHLVMRDAPPKASVLLDPPRKGVASGVLEAIASRQPDRVVHIFCNIDLIASDLKQWASYGYRAAAAVPVDMFPGTASMEVLLLLQRAT
jgi:tRNA/tmRNA/rRNA uracil-C5-methylase (TrmA/RlmC/RlmD family)